MQRVDSTQYTGANALTDCRSVKLQNESVDHVSVTVDDCRITNFLVNDRSRVKHAQPREVRLATVFVVGIVCVIVACGGGPTTPSTSPIGAWGGDHISLTISDAGGRVDFDCAHGEIQNPWVLDAQQAFNVRGTFVRDRGGPVRIDDVLEAHPAAYAGSVTGNTMVLTVELTDTKDVIGTFALTRGAPARVVKCLLPTGTPVN